jgi:hypothetical protein
MVQEFNITRGGKEYQVKVGITTDKKSRLYLEDAVADEELGLKGRWMFGSLFVDTDDQSDEGEVVLIRTTWKKKLMSPTGMPIPGYQVIEIMITNEEDIKSFMTMFGSPILLAMINGLVRQVWGFNHFPVFNPNGTVKTLTEFESSTQPTNDYYTWKQGDDLPEVLTEPEIEG